ncbi:hypothetical protein [Algoriphagus sediminis]|uniref:TIR domain-containing protein n=1 Tax=Algoriphagus sediminis TaxID=3057113 RepID=A0ABT7YGE6_9BACT|nr:hypothetical protein [Algoriphagus sediminis]MDN3205599.1 hypothetical protein [Algoriphagus sediminis]
MKKLRIFLASSNELKEEREQFEIHIYRKCQELFEQKQIFLYLDIWENMSTKMSRTHSQDEYNKFVRDADIVVVLAYTKVGEYTFSEFENAKRTFKSTNKPFLFVYFKADPPYTGNNLKDLQSLEDFKKLLADGGYFYPSFKDFDNLWNQFNKELDRLATSDFKELVRGDTPDSQNANSAHITGNRNKTYQGMNNSTITDNSINQTHSGTGDNVGGDKKTGK